MSLFIPFSICATYLTLSIYRFQNLFFIGSLKLNKKMILLKYDLYLLSCLMANQRRKAAQQFKILKCGLSLMQEIQIIETVQENTEEIQAFYRSKGIDTVFQMNPGNHFVQGIERTIAGIQWLLSR